MHLHRRSLCLTKKQFSVELQEPISIASLISMTHMLIYICYLCTYLHTFYVYMCMPLLSTIPAGES